MMGCLLQPQNDNSDSGQEVSILKRPNVLVIMIDDLNDCIAGLNGHQQNYSPHIKKLADSGVLFTNAHTNAPMCGPSRASLFSGIYPHNSENYYQAPWMKNEVLSNSKMMMEHFKDAGYNVMGSGKILHHNVDELWTHFENPADYSPTPYDGEERVPHPDVPSPFYDIGWVDGSFGPFINLENRKSPTGKSLHWTTGNPKIGYKPMKYINDEDRDPTPDEVNAKWAVDQLESLAKDKREQPFFLAVGFLRPHTPLVAPQKYFDRFPLADIEVSVIKDSDVDDTYLKVAYKDGDVHALRFGKEMYEAMVASYGSAELGLKKWTQAYLACVAAVDDNVGQVMAALDNSKLKDNTIVVLASDHGFHMGEKNYLYKNSLWEESTRVPLIVRVPGITKAGKEVVEAVSLIDVYPTLVDICQLSSDTQKNEKGHPLDGESLKPFLAQINNAVRLEKPVLTAVYAGDKHNNRPEEQHYALRTEQYRYILYNTGHEELYDHNNDPYEWTNLAASDDSKRIIVKMRKDLEELLAPHDLVGLSQLK